MRVLPADVYDALEFSALVFGGIGAGRYASGWLQMGHEPTAAPLCVYGHAHSMEPRSHVATDALSRVGVSSGENDVAVRRINTRKDKPRDSRVSFAEWCAELNVVRGES